MTATYEDATWLRRVTGNRISFNVSSIVVRGMALLLCATLATAHVSAQQEAVSQDLISLYQTADQTPTVEAVSQLIEELKKVYADRGRSAADRAYARDLLSWAFNRRGEMLGDLAAEKVNLGETEEAAKLDTEAAKDFRLSLKLNPQRWRARHNLAIALAMSNQFDDAIEQFGIVIREEPKYDNAYFNRAELYFQTDRFEEAVEDYTTAIRLKPNDAQYYNSLAHSLLMLKRNKEALASYRKAADLESDNAVWWADLADAYQFLGQWKEALATYQQAIQVDREMGRAYQNAAWLMATCPDAKVRNPKSALLAARRAIELDGEDEARYLDTLAAALAANGQFNDAVETMKEALKKAPEEELALMKQRLVAYQNKQGFQTKPSKIATASSPVRTAAENEPIGTGARRR